MKNKIELVMEKKYKTYSCEVCEYTIYSKSKKPRCPVCGTTKLHIKYEMDKD